MKLCPEGAVLFHVDGRTWRRWQSPFAVSRMRRTLINWIIIGYIRVLLGRSQWPRGLRRRSAAARLLRLWVWIPPGAWMFVCCECCVLSGRGLGDELITRPEESYRLWCVVVCDLETPWMRRPWPTGGCRARNKKVLLEFQKSRSTYYEAKCYLKRNLYSLAWHILGAVCYPWETGKKSCKRDGRRVVCL